jgi:hypothetical protein
VEFLDKVEGVYRFRYECGDEVERLCLSRTQKVAVVLWGHAVADLLSWHLL